MAGGGTGFTPWLDSKVGLTAPAGLLQVVSLRDIVGAKVAEIIVLREKW